MNKKWIGFDLDGTLAVDTPDRADDTIIGEPIPKMIDKLKYHLQAGNTCKIFTGRAHNAKQETLYAIEDWCKKNIEQVLEIVDYKDHDLIFFYDDKAIEVEYNTGNIYI